jgi:toxin HigB-1
MLRCIAKKLRLWVRSVETVGLEETHKRPGYHDEPFAGQLAALRSIRLNKAHPAYCRIDAAGSVEFVQVTHLDKHKY